MLWKWCTHIFQDPFFMHVQWLRPQVSKNRFSRTESDLFATTETSVLSAFSTDPCFSSRVQEEQLSAIPGSRVQLFWSQMWSHLKEYSYYSPPHKSSHSPTEQTQNEIKEIKTQLEYVIQQTLFFIQRIELNFFLNTTKNLVSCKSTEKKQRKVTYIKSSGTIATHMNIAVISVLLKQTETSSYRPISPITAT